MGPLAAKSMLPRAKFGIQAKGQHWPDGVWLRLGLTAMVSVSGVAGSPTRSPRRGRRRAIRGRELAYDARGVVKRG